MKSPFPGMDPYLERRWQDVHHRICTYACDQLQEQLGGELVARLGERLVVETLFNESRSICSDPEHQAFVQIIEPDIGRLITVIEFLSPSNKLTGDGRKQYQAKQRELNAAELSLAEIDLLRVGRRCFMIPEVQIPPPESRATYMACVFRGYRALKFDIYAMPLRQRLPAIRIPLRAGDPDIGLDLQPLIDKAYRNGRYDLTDYRAPCIPPLEGEDATWADELLRAAGNDDVSMS